VQFAGEQAPRVKGLATQEDAHASSRIAAAIEMISSLQSFGEGG
jgi:hypothetical protein